MVLHWPDHSWYFSSTFPPSSFLGCFHHDISWCLPLVLHHQTWRFWRACCHRSGLACPCMCDAHSTYWCIILGIYTLPKISRGHAAGMYFSHWSDHHLDGLHCFSCACQHGPSWGWMVRRTIPPFSSCQNWNGRLLPIESFWKVILLRRFLPRFPCAQTSRIYPCRTFLQNPIPVCRLVLPTSWGRREGEYCWVLQGTFYWQRLIQGKSEGNYLVPLVVWKISWTGDIEVLSLCIPWRISACC